MKSRAFAGDRDVTAGEVAAGITQEKSKERIAAPESKSIAGIMPQLS